MYNRPASTIFYHENVFKKLDHSIQSGRTFTEREISLQIQQQESIVDLNITPLISGSSNKTKEVLLEITPQDRHLRISREEMLFSQQQVSRELLRSMAHEVKNPLGGIRGAYHHITVMGKEEQENTHCYDVTGSLCENNDKFAIDRQLPEISAGDTLAIHDAGAHGHSMGFNYNGKLRSAELLLREDNSVLEIRRAETLDDYFATLDFEQLKEFN